MKCSTWCLGLVFGIGLLLLTACGQPVPRLGMSIRGLDSRLLKQISFLDMALFEGRKITCQQITPDNYKSDKKVIQESRIPPFKNKNDIVAPLFVKESRPYLLQNLVEGRNLVVFVVAFNNDKKSMAEGCIGNVNLFAGQTKVIPIKLKPIQ